MKLLFLIFLSLLALASSSVAQSDYQRIAASLTEGSLPLVNLQVDESIVSPYYFVPARIEIADPLCRTNGSMVFSADCQVRYRGNSSCAYPKKSFAIKLLDSVGEDLDANVLGVREENSWILDAMANDRLRMRNRLCFDVWNSFSHTPYDTKYDNRNGIVSHHVEVFINGTYHGLYCLSDKVDRKLLALKKPKVQEVDSVQKVTIRGLLYKCVSWGFGSTLMYRHQAVVPDFSTSVWEAYELKLPEEYPSRESWQPLYDVIGYYQNAFTATEYIRHYNVNFYRQNTLDYLALCAFMYLRDNMMKNTYLSIVDKNVEQRLLITPWDMDTSLGGDWNGDYSDKLVTDLNEFMSICAPYEALRKDSSFRKEFDALMSSLYESTFSIQLMTDRMVSIAQPIVKSGAWAREVAKWGGDQTVPLDPNLMNEVRQVLNWYHDNLQALGFSPADVSVPEVESALPSVNVKITTPNVYTLAGQRVTNPSPGRIYVNSQGVFIMK